LLADLRLAPVFERADADGRPLRFDDVFFRPPPALRRDFDFVLAMKLLLNLRLWALARAIKMNGHHAKNVPRAARVKHLFTRRGKSLGMVAAKRIPHGADRAALT
jgi:hypothetical protein